MFRVLRDIYLQRSHLRCYEDGRKSLKVTIGVLKVCISCWDNQLILQAANQLVY
jgi:hypothetical protein